MKEKIPSSKNWKNFLRKKEMSNKEVGNLADNWKTSKEK